MSREYRWRSLTPKKVRAIQSAAAHPRVLASAYGVSVRTIYRALRMPLETTVPVRLSDWEAEFIMDRLGPRQVSPWCPVERAS